MKQNDIIALFDDDRKLVNAIERLKTAKIPVRDVYTPFPVHDVLKLLGRESRLPYFSVVAGIAVIIMVLGFLYYTAVVDYPLRYGGKPYFAFPSFVVIIYLLTILLTFISTVLVFHFRTGLYPGKETGIASFGTTDDRFALAIEGGKADDGSAARINSILTDSGAIEIIENGQS